MYHEYMAKNTNAHNWHDCHAARSRRHAFGIRVNAAEYDAISGICRLLDISVSDVLRQWLAGTRVKNVASRLLVKTMLQCSGLMLSFGADEKIPELASAAGQLQNSIIRVSAEILPTTAADIIVPTRNTTESRRTSVITVWLDDDEHQVATAMKTEIGVPATQAFRKFVVEKLIPTTEATLMHREILEIMMREFKEIACAYDIIPREQYIDSIVAYAQRIVNTASTF